MPALQYVTLEDSARAWMGKQFSFPSGDPISRYVLNNMTPIKSFPISNELSVRCFIDNASARILEKKLKIENSHKKY